MTELKVVLPDVVATELASEASRRGTSVEELAAEFIGSHVSVTASRPRRNLDWIGAWNSGRRDLSERVEEILGKYFDK